MIMQKAAGRYENGIIMAVTMMVNIVLMGICFDFYYDLNDDVLMKDIMAGVYTGTPDGHNMQTLYILGAAIAFLYRVCDSLPWYGIFLFLCQMGSVYLVGVRLLRFCQSRRTKAVCISLLSVFLWGILLPHLTAVQYTVTCTMLAGAAVFLFMTTESGLSIRQFIIRNIPAVLLVILAYQLRTEMLLLVFPFIGLAGLFRWMEEEHFFRKENYRKYGAVIGLILCGMLISRLIDFAAYGSEDWKRFLVFFEKRTEVYDFHPDILTSGEHREYLYSIGLNDAQQKLLENYNFGLDERIDEIVLGKIAAYASTEQATGIPADRRLADLFHKLGEKGRFYLYRTLHGEDAPYNRLILIGYLCVLFAEICSMRRRRVSGPEKQEPERRRRLWKSFGKILAELMLLAVVRTGLWMFILMRDRDPVRITHSLYLAEWMVLLGMILLRSGAAYHAGRIKWALPVLLAVLGLSYLPRSILAVMADGLAREEANRGALAIAEYCREHPDSFYFEDVYSTVGFSQKLFQNTDNSPANYDIMGGWMCKSPLYREKLRHFGIETMEDGLLSGNSVFFITQITEETEAGEAADKGTMTDTLGKGADTDWLTDYYAGKGIRIRLEQIDLIGGKYAVFRLESEKDAAFS